MGLTKRTKIVATLGPASRSPEMILALIEAGVDVFRLNFSHGSPEEHRRSVAMIREASAKLGRTIAVLQDLRGPKIRCGQFRGGAVELQAGQRFTITADPVEGDETRVSTTYRGLPNDVQPGQILLLDDGNIRLRVEEVRQNDIHTTVLVGGKLSDNKGINIPGADLSIPALTDKDIEDIALGAELEMDWVAISFVRSRDDLLLARHYLTRYNSRARLMAKIEKPSAVARFDEILEEADGIMVARGDLGVEMPLEEVPAVQKRIILKAVQAGKAVVTATQMLESMVRNPIPTRAEASDVANAIFDGTDAIMLSAETATGMYPVEAVSFMTRVAKTIEATQEYQDRLNALRPPPNRTVQDAIARAVDDVVESTGAKAIVVFTATGGAARRVARTRPPVPILALTPNPYVRNQLALVSDVLPLLAPDPKDTDDMVQIAVEKAKETGLVEVGEYVVIVAGVPFGVRGTTNMIRVERVS
ncbi:MAG: pyruvate kinase [Meiothermus sp.]|uniref:pyruvate kinase n=1 Tax=Meiothermus sp. TaxID=1955249 RepID=UPI0025EAD750|nr:pyruvate kinase [Meiothermus sp.]MCS7057301.1 pyruvate kinase [Meiothermus sp.]MCS7194878.1 pyruvate kinase [Meiothermus sp.]MCX7739512.1 pyruvate kinase [Meiothermus sp.]MDW8091268.1 pyruvate kinase [Meiothermus sp.]MDW8480386.1 pyruvate kinase [Meiothermus sp.]